MGDVQRVYIVRHGETADNATGRWQGTVDTPLNDLGRQQAAHLAQYLRAQNETIESIYTSDLARARETAEIIAQAYGHQVVPDARLREVHVGVFQGLTNAEIDERYPQMRQRWRQDHAYAVPDGESRSQVQQRMIGAWQEWTEHLSLSNLMIVSHGVAIRMLLHGLFPDVDHSYELPNTCLTVLQRLARGWSLECAGKIAHLE